MRSALGASHAAIRRSLLSRKPGPLRQRRPGRRAGGHSHGHAYLARYALRYSVRAGDLTVDFRLALDGFSVGVGSGILSCVRSPSAFRR